MADKGTKITIVDKQQYTQGEALLADQKTCKKLDKDPTPLLASKIKQYTNELYEAGYLDKHERQYQRPNQKTNNVFFTQNPQKKPPNQTNSLRTKQPHLQPLLFSRLLFHTTPTQYTQLPKKLQRPRTNP